MRPKIVVIGSSNTDMVVRTERMPQGGETVLGGEFVMVPGGKGANQAVCAAKLGADVHFVAKIGDDVFGQASLDNFEKVGIDTKYVMKDPSVTSGVALIVVDKKAENAIVVAPGANFALAPEDVESAKDVIAGADAVILQLEIPLETVERAINLASESGVKVVLNPAPMRSVSRELLSKVSVLVLNQHEAAQLLGKDGQGENIDAESSANELMQLGVECVVITLGSKGAYVASSGISTYIEPLKVKAVDTTAAGDTFTASLVCALAEKQSLADAAVFAAKVAAITVTKVGAQISMPTRAEVDSFKHSR